MGDVQGEFNLLPVLEFQPKGQNLEVPKGNTIKGISGTFIPENVFGI